LTDKRFILCEFNKYGSSHRSPHSQTLVPPLAQEPQHLSDILQTFESHANEVWEAYTQLYYGKDALGSVYVKEVSASLVACFLISKSVQNDERLAEGQWDSVHMVHIGKVVNASCTYKISSHILVSMDPTADTSLSAQVSRTTKQTHPVTNQQYSSHLENMGKMIEDIEIELRSNLDAVTIPKTQQVLSGLRRKQGGTGMGIPVIMAPVRPRPKGGMPMPGMMMGGAHAAALNAAVLKRAPKQS
jgi:capping protein (actin filament) muscle Z-line, beta